MISGSLSSQRTAAAQIAPTELPVLTIPASPSECIPLCSNFSPCSIEAEERLRDMFVRPMNEKMDRLWGALLMPLSPDCIIHAQQQPNFISSPITELKQKRSALLFD